MAKLKGLLTFQADFAIMKALETVAETNFTSTSGAIRLLLAKALDKEIPGWRKSE